MSWPVESDGLETLDPPSLQLQPSLPLQHSHMVDLQFQWLDLEPAAAATADGLPDIDPLLLSQLQQQQENFPWPCEHQQLGHSSVQIPPPPQQQQQVLLDVGVLQQQHGQLHNVSAIAATAAEPLLITTNLQQQRSSEGPYTWWLQPHNVLQQYFDLRCGKQCAAAAADGDGNAYKASNSSEIEARLALLLAAASDAAAQHGYQKGNGQLQLQPHRPETAAAAAAAAALEFAVVTGDSAAPEAGSSSNSNNSCVGLPDQAAAAEANSSTLTVRDKLPNDVPHLLGPAAATAASSSSSNSWKQCFLAFSSAKGGFLKKQDNNTDVVCCQLQDGSSVLAKVRPNFPGPGSKKQECKQQQPQQQGGGPAAALARDLGLSLLSIAGRYTITFANGNESDSNDVDNTESNNGSAVASDQPTVGSEKLRIRAHRVLIMRDGPPPPVEQQQQQQQQQQQKKKEKQQQQQQQQQPQYWKWVAKIGKWQGCVAAYLLPGDLLSPKKSALLPLLLPQADSSQPAATGHAAAGAAAPVGNATSAAAAALAGNATFAAAPAGNATSAAAPAHTAGPPGPVPPFETATSAAQMFAAVISPPPPAAAAAAAAAAASRTPSPAGWLHGFTLAGDTDDHNDTDPISMMLRGLASSNRSLPFLGTSASAAAAAANTVLPGVEQTAAAGGCRQRQQQQQQQQQLTSNQQRDRLFALNTEYSSPVAAAAAAPGTANWQQQLPQPTAVSAALESSPIEHILGSSQNDTLAAAATAAAAADSGMPMTGVEQYAASAAGTDSFISFMLQQSGAALHTPRFMLQQSGAALHTPRFCSDPAEYSLLDHMLADFAALESDSEDMPDSEPMLHVPHQIIQSQQYLQLQHLQQQASTLVVNLLSVFAGCYGGSSKSVLVNLLLSAADHNKWVDQLAQQLPDPQSILGYMSLSDLAPTAAAAAGVGSSPGFWVDLVGISDHFRRTPLHLLVGNCRGWGSNPGYARTADFSAGIRKWLFDILRGARNSSNSSSILITGSSPIAVAANGIRSSHSGFKNLLSSSNVSGATPWHTACHFCLPESLDQFVNNPHFTLDLMLQPTKGGRLFYHIICREARNRADQSLHKQGLVKTLWCLYHKLAAQVQGCKSCDIETHRQGMNAADGKELAIAAATGVGIKRTRPDFETQRQQQQQQQQPQEIFGSCSSSKHHLCPSVLWLMEHRHVRQLPRPTYDVAMLDCVVQQEFGFVVRKPAGTITQLAEGHQQQR